MGEEKKKFNKQNYIGLAVIIIIVAVAAYYFGASKKPAQLAYPSNNSNYKSSDNDNSVPAQNPSVYDYIEAAKHIGEYASVKGKIAQVHKSNKGTVFFDYCPSYKGCPFSAVIFASAAGNFNNPVQYEGQEITVTGKISSYQGSAEIILDSPNQISQ
ncbi:MAG: hypothetical protein NTZ97_01315 [Candidatus Moranbacteria bacterium]|nr:hypothetical protein [Candidatus Moranbacteria bacterium]